MTKAEHLDFLSTLERGYGKGNMSCIKKEGAFWFDHYDTWDEYTDKYRAECMKNGWVKV